jgi:amidohydrolase
MLRPTNPGEPGLRQMNRIFRSVLFAGAAVVLAQSAQAAPAGKIGDAVKQKAQIDAGLDKAYPHLEALYKDLHQHPEPAFQETATAAKLAKEMRDLGFEVTEQVGKTGIVAILKNGPGPTVMVRTELDALPMEEKTGLPYASHATQTWQGKPSPVAHSCGHDIHMAAWVGAAQQLVAMKAQWRGTLMFIGQPAEEALGGAHAMIADGLFTRWPKPDLGFAQHVGPGPAGGISYRPGVNSSAADSFEVAFVGRGSHGSRPQLSIDPVMEAARFAVDVQAVISREKDPAAFGVVGVGAIQAGSAGNIIPDAALVRGTIRSYEPEVRVKLKEGLVRTAKAVAEMSAAPPPTVTFDQGAAAVVNDEAVTARTAPVFKAAFGDHAVLSPGPGSASEDYSEYIIAGVPSLFWGLGGVEPKVIAQYKARGEVVPGNHTPQFAPAPEPAIRTGVEAMTLAVLGVMGK